MRYLNLFLFLSYSIFFFSCNEPTVKESPTTKEQGPVHSTNVPEIDKLSQKIAQSPNDAELYFQRAESYYEHQGYDPAIRDLQKALSIDSMQAPYYHLLADVFLDYYQSRNALKTMQAAAAKFPDRIPTLLKLAEFHMILKQYPASLFTINKVLKIDKENAEAYFMMGMTFKENKDTVKAINSFQTAVEFDPELIDGWMILGDLFFAKKKKIAERYYNTAVAIDPLNPATKMARGYYRHQMGNLKGAEEDYMDITKLDQQNASAFLNLGLLNTERDSFDKAYQNFDFAIKANPMFAPAYYYRGYISEIKGQNASAVKDYKQAITFNPDFEAAIERLAKLQAQQ